MGPEHASPEARLTPRAILTEAPDHYELHDLRLVGRLAGVLFVIGGVLAALLLLAEPPTHHVHGTAGWALGFAIVASAFASGAVMLRIERLLPPWVLLGVGISGPIMLGALQWLSGPRSSFDALLGLSMMWCGVVLPGRRLIGVLLWTTLVAALPILSGDVSRALLDRKLVGIAFLWVLTLASIIWAHRIREIRRELRDERAAADELARVDPLTGLGNRRALDEALAAQVALAGRTQRPLSALVGDLDRFKAINDVHGHHVGDRLLGEVAAVLRDVVRRPDACFRWGGDEFVVLLAEADRHDAEGVAERVRAAVASRCGAPGGQPVGLSLGVATLLEGGTGLQLLRDADAALLAAKDEARSRRVG